MIIRHDNHEINGVASNDERARNIGISNEDANDNGDEINENEERHEVLVTDSWKDETNCHPSTTLKSHEDDESMKQTPRDTCNTNSTNHDKVENDPARKVKETIHSKEDIIKPPTKTKYLNNTRPRAGAIGSKVRFLWSPGTKKTMCLV